MKKKILKQKVIERNDELDELEALMKTIVRAIKSPVQVKKLLADEKLVDLLKKHNITL